LFNPLRAAVRSAKGGIVINEKSQAELRLLNKEQQKAQQDEVFGGLSRAERAQFNRRAERIQDLESEIQSGRGH